MRKITFIVLLIGTVNGFSQTIDSLLHVVKSTQNDSIKAEALYYLTFQYVNSDLNLARNTNAKAFKIAQDLHSDYALARAFNAKGVIHDVEGNIDSAYICYRKSLTFAEKSKSVLTKASVINNLGLLEWNKGNYDQAIQYYNQSLTLFEQINNANGIANTLSNIGLIYADIENYSKAEQYTLLALQTREKTNDIYGISVSLINLGNIKENKSLFKEAIKAYEKAVQYKIKLKDEKGLATVYNNLTSLYIKIKLPEKATQYAYLSLAISEKLQSKLHLIYAYAALSDAFIFKGNYADSYKFIQKGIALSLETDNKLALTEFYERIEELERANGNYEKAYVFLKKKDSVKNYLFNLEKEKSINEIEAQYQSVKREKEIALQKEQLYKNNLKLKNNRLTMALMLSGFLLALVGGIAYLKRQQHIKRQLKREMELKSALQEAETQHQLQTERLRISRDLHDNIGSQLSFVVSSLDNLNFKLKGKSVETRQNISEISLFTKNTITELRDTIWALNKSEINLDTIELRIQSFIERARASYPNVNILFISKDKNDVILSSFKGINILRLIQEAVNNALKHAEAQNITLQLHVESPKLVILIQDDGKGFDLNQVSGGYGLDNMQKRVQELNGNLQIFSQIGNGTKIIATFVNI